MGRWWIILLLLLGVWQIVGTLIEKAGKKQQEQRLRDLAARQGREGAARAEPGPSARTATDRAEALAARRREQLEQLRQRRAAQRRAVEARPSPVPPTGRAPAAPPAAGPRPVSPPRPSPFQPAPGPRQTRAPAASRPAPVPVARRPSRLPVPERQPVAAPREEPAPIEGESTTRRVVFAAEEAPAAAPPRRHLPLPFTPGEPLGPHLLRQMVLFREILEPPVALRDHQVWERV